MANNDFLQRFIFDKAPIRGEYVHLEDSFQTIINQHPYPEPLKRLLGEALCVAVMLSAIIKFEGRLTVQFRGSGKLRMLLAQCDNQFHLRALAKWEEGEFSYEDLMASFKRGVLVITLDSTGKGGHYQGIVSWRGNSLVESIEGYFKDSEQLATKIWLGVSEKTAVGLLLQVIPGSSKEAVGIEQDIIQPHWNSLMNATQSLSENELLNFDYETLLRTIYPEEAIRVFKEVPVSFQCTCSRKKSEDAILLLGRHEVDEEIANKNSLVVTCDFCNKEYVFDRVDIAHIFEKKDKGKPTSDTVLH